MQAMQSGNSWFYIKFNVLVCHKNYLTEMVLKSHIIGFIETKVQAVFTDFREISSISGDV